MKLREAAQNEGYREPVYKGHPLKATLLLDSENIVQLRLDLEKFVLGCEIYPFRKSCIEVFHWQLDSFGVCYVGELNIHATRKETPLLIDFYFDPELSRMNNISGLFPTSQQFLNNLSILMQGELFFWVYAWVKRFKCEPWLELLEPFTSFCRLPN